MDSPRITRALISTSDKTGLAEFAGGLVRAGIEIISTGGTRRHLEEAGLPVRDISDLTGFPEIMDGRVKTLHPKVHGGILCRHNSSEDRSAMAAHGIVPIELVVVNLYPFEATVARPGVSPDEVIEQIDIGGPSLVRGAAKNHAFTTVVTSPGQYARVLGEIESRGSTTYELRRELAGAAYAHTAAYDRAIADWFAGQTAAGPFPATLTLRYARREVLRYGENPHQQAALYAEENPPGASLVGARQLHGKELSYNNLLDLDSALALVREFDRPMAVVVKHTNPCGAAMSDNLSTALERALSGDPLAAFGSVLGLNRPVDLATAEVLCAPGLFVEAIVAPEFEPAAVEALTTRPTWKANVRLLAVGPLDALLTRWNYRSINGGMLVQERDAATTPVSDWKVKTTTVPREQERRELAYAWSLVRFVKSNAIVVTSETTLRGCGPGLTSRVDAVELALSKAGSHARGAVLASDAFFPFADSIEKAAAAGIAAVIQPGGAKKDDEVIAACDRHGIAMIFTGRRHFKH